VIKSKPIEPEGVERYLESKFGDALPEVRKAMTELANAVSPDELAQRGFGLYEQFLWRSRKLTHSCSDKVTHPV